MKTSEPIVEFRFSLKTALIIVALLCVLLGTLVALDRRAANMVARRDAIYRTLAANLAEMPDGATAIGPNGGLMGGGWLHDKSWILHAGKSQSFGQEHIEWRLEPGLGRPRDVEALQSLAEHLERGLQDLNLHNDNAVRQDIGNAYRYVGVWREYDDPEFTVVIDVVIDPAGSQQAGAWVAVIENQPLVNWSALNPYPASPAILILILFAWIYWLVHRRKSQQNARAARP